jgi:cytoskeletal protein CcmA (bactofilin family)
MAVKSLHPRKTNRVKISQDNFMKITAFIFASILLSSSTIINAEELRRGGSIFANIEQNGDVRINGSIKGRFESNGDIRVNGSIEGRIESDGSIRKNGSIVGKVESNGDVRIDGSIKGRIESDGDVRENGSIIGSARGIEKEQAAAIFFFNFF